MGKGLIKYKIEKNVPMPPRKNTSWRPLLDKMEIGDSILIAIQHRQSVLYAVGNIKRYDKYYITRKIDDKHFRIWRIAKPVNEDIEL